MGMDTNSEFCVISSSCISGFWYRDIIQGEYEVPFIWSIIKLSNMLFLIKNFDKLNFKNIAVEISEGEIKRTDESKWVKVVLDDKIKVILLCEN